MNFQHNIFMSSIQTRLKIAQNQFNAFIDQIERSKINDVAIRRALKNYDLKSMKINYVTPLRAKKMYEILFIKYQQAQAYDQCWLQNQRRIFLFVLVCYIHKNELQITNLKQRDFLFFHELFPLKDIRLIKFQAFSILKKDIKGSKWSETQDKLLKDVIERHLSQGKHGIQNEHYLEWGNISKQFFVCSGQKYFRNSKQCRQRWQNHLDPNTIKGKWEVDQEIILLREALSIGKKWSKIAEKFNGKKNQHMVKNRYKSLIHKIQKEYKGKKMTQEQIIKLLLNRLQNNQKVENNKKIHFQNYLSIQEEKSQDENSVFSSYKQEENIILQSFKSAREQNYNVEKKTCEKFEQGFREQYKQDEINMPLHKKNSCRVLIEPQEQKVKEKVGTVQNNKILEKIVVEQNNINLNKENLQEGGDNKMEDIEAADRLNRDPNPTPLPQINRYSSVMLDPRSPANFMVSPFPWTPTIFFVEDYQGNMSPQVGFSSFCSKFTNQFAKFVGDDHHEHNN